MYVLLYICVGIGSLLILSFFVFPLYAHISLVFKKIMLHRLSGVLSLAKLGHQAVSHLSDHFKIIISEAIRLTVCVGMHHVLWFVMDSVLYFRAIGHKRIQYYY